MKQPDCKKLRRTCQELDVTIKIADLENDTRTEKDDAATWIIGHHERISFGAIYDDGKSMLVDARIHVPCRFLYIASAGEPDAAASCKLYDFKGPIPKSKRQVPTVLQPGAGRFTIVRKGTRKELELALKGPVEKGKKRKLPVVESPNPCAAAPCRTSDNKKGAACCRDLKLELLVPKSSKNKMALLRTRKSPYLCKVKRENKRLVEVEVISACGYLAEEDGITCVLHDRRRPNGKKAKPQLCYDWPDFGNDETGHAGCVFS
jgi:glutaredoxin